MPGFEEEVESGRRIDQDFIREDYRLRAKIISSGYKDLIVPRINQYDFTMACKLALGNIVDVSFDPNVMLARNPEISSRITRLEIEQNLAVASYAESDVTNSGLLNIDQTITDAFCDFVSPSIGGKERDRITKQESVTHQSYSGLPGQETAQKRGFRLPWSRD